MYTPKHFKLEEFLKSDHLDKLHITNFPSFEVVENLSELARHLDIIREKFGKAIKVNSGYRCKVLNDYLKSTDTSWHLRGRASDICPLAKSNREKELIRLKEIVCDYVGITRDLSNGKKACKAFEVIFYPTFIHIAIRP